MSNRIFVSSTSCTPSVEHASVLMGGYACADAGTPFGGRVRITAKQLPGTQVWSPPT